MKENRHDITILITDTDIDTLLKITQQTCIPTLAESNIFDTVTEYIWLN